MSRNDLSQEILDVTESMYIAAMQSDWEKLNDLQLRQAVLLQSCSMSSGGIDVSVLQKISDLTKQVIELAEACKHEIGGQLLQFKKNANAKNAYLQNFEQG
jgi:hypothetical protein